MNVHHNTVKTDEIGILLLNLGTPDAPTYMACRRFLAEFLGDKRVVEMPRLMWFPILYGPILTFRPFKTAKAYAKIWNDGQDGQPIESPLRTYARTQAERLSKHLEGTAHVAWAFRYGSPSVQDGLSQLRAKGCTRILVAALFPQYSATTTATAYDKVFSCLAQMRWQPAVRTLPAYYDKPAYTDALKTSVTKALSEIDFKPDHIIASYHSIPKTYWQKGDPYPCHCMGTSNRLTKAMGWADDYLITTFQSRVGFNEWVGPFSADKVKELANRGVKRIAIITPAFSVDCLETLEEVNMELRHIFLSNGGEKFHYIPCLNASDEGITMLEHVTKQEISGWA